MAVIRSFADVQRLQDLTDPLNEIPLQYGLISAMGIYDEKTTSQTSIVFDKNSKSITMLPSQNRAGQKSSYGVQSDTQPFSLPLAYFKHKDFIVASDIQDHRATNIGGGDISETLANVQADKLESMKFAAEQSIEYMKLKALTGVFVTPDGVTYADTPSLFGVSVPTATWSLSSASFEIDTKFIELKQTLAQGVKDGGTISGVTMLCSPEFYTAMVQNASFRELYANYQNPMLTASQTEYMQYGALERFSHRGIDFILYDATFTKPDGTTVAGITAGTAIAIPKGVRGMFLSYFGPANKLSGANKMGQKMFAYQYNDQRDEQLELEIEFAPLFVNVRPTGVCVVTAA